MREFILWSGLGKNWCSCSTHANRWKLEEKEGRMFCRVTEPRLEEGLYGPRRWLVWPELYLSLSDIQYVSVFTEQQQQQFGRRRWRDSRSYSSGPDCCRATPSARSCTGDVSSCEAAATTTSLPRRSIATLHALPETICLLLTFDWQFVVWWQHRRV